MREFQRPPIDPTRERSEILSDALQVLLDCAPQHQRYEYTRAVAELEAWAWVEEQRERRRLGFAGDCPPGAVDDA